MADWNIVALDGETANPGDNPWTAIEALGNLVVYPRTETSQTLLRARDADILLTNKVVIDDALMQRLPRLKFIAVMATGFNVVDVAAARKRGIPVSNVPEYSTDSVAQFVFAGLLSFIHRPELHHDAIHDGDWQRSRSFSFWKQPTFELAGKTLGIVGLGKIGRAVARLAHAFEMKVVAHSRSHHHPLDVPDFRWLDVEELFASSDIVSLHCPLTESNAGFVNHALLSRCKSSLILINTARGGLINEVDLTAALNAGDIAGAILDVVSTEPIAANSPLLSAQNCRLTPHMAWTTIEARRRLMQTTAENISQFLVGDPINQVSLPN